MEGFIFIGRLRPGGGGGGGGGGGDRPCVLRAEKERKVLGGKRL